jgi:hypothetical protein
MIKSPLFSLCASKRFWLTPSDKKFRCLAIRHSLEWKFGESFQISDNARPLATACLLSTPPQVF